MTDPRAGDRLDTPSRLSPVALPVSGGAHRVEIAGGRITAIRPAHGAPEWLLLPAFANMHTHAERSFAPASVPKSFTDAVRQSEEIRQRSSEADFCARATTLFTRALGHGTLRLRSHTDIDDLVEERALRGVLAARKVFAGRLDVEIVAFANARVDPAGHEGQARLLAALGRGADLIGAVPALTPDPRRTVTAVLDLARAEGASVDFHLDEHGTPGDSLLSFVIDGIIARGLERRVTVSHICALATLPRAEAQETARRLAATAVTVIVLPGTNLYLQDRGDETPRRRGVTLVKELFAAGVPVWFGSDNVRDSFYPYGDADPLEDAFLASLAAHVDKPAQLLMGLSAGRGEPQAGDAADLVLVKATSLIDALARRPAARIVLRAGKVVVGGARS